MHLSLLQKCNCWSNHSVGANWCKTQVNGNSFHANAPTYFSGFQYSAKFRSVFKNGPRKICGSQPLKNLFVIVVCLDRLYHFKFFKGCHSQIFLVHSWIPWPIWYRLQEGIDINKNIDRSIVQNDRDLRHERAKQK